jgi:hypothetical protein
VVAAPRPLDFVADYEKNSSAICVR